MKNINENATLEMISTYYDAIAQSSTNKGTVLFHFVLVKHFNWREGNIGKYIHTTHLVYLHKLALYSLIFQMPSQQSRENKNCASIAPLYYMPISYLLFSWLVRHAGYSDSQWNQSKIVSYGTEKVCCHMSMYTELYTE